jgi:hypothetical protein
LLGDLHSIHDFKTNFHIDYHLLWDGPAMIFLRGSEMGGKTGGERPGSWWDLWMDRCNDVIPVGSSKGCCLLWIEKSRVKEKTYKWGSVRHLRD